MKYRNNVFLRIPQATGMGYIECPVWGCFDFSYPSSLTRRGRVQDGGRICPTLTCNSTGIVTIVAHET